jgi:hypothetical protein
MSSKPKGFYFPDIAKLESEDAQVRYREEKKADESLKLMAKQDAESKPSFYKDFAEGFASPFTWIWDKGKQSVHIIDDTLGSAGKVVDGFKWLTEHPLIFIMLLTSLGIGGVIIVRRIGR